MPRPLAAPPLEALILRFITLDNQINTLEEQLKDLKAQRKQVGEDEITNEVDEQDEPVRTLGVRLSDGTEYVFEQDLHCGIKKGDKPAAYAWLEAHHVGHLLKRTISVALGNDSAALAHWLVKKLEDQPRLTDLPITVDRELPGASLTAFVRKCQVAGINLPPEFGVYAPLRPVKQQPQPQDVLSAADAKPAAHSPNEESPV